MADKQAFTLSTKPGVQRDGTVLDAPSWTDGEWVRFQRGRPRKMGGYRSISSQFTGPVRAVYVWSRQTFNGIYAFSPSAVEELLVDANGTGAGLFDRTPVGFTADDNSIWTVDTMYDDAAGSDKTLIIAHRGYGLDNIDDGTAGEVYYGGANETAALAAASGLVLSGGIVCGAPFLVLYGSDGQVTWSNENEPRNITTGSAGSDRITGSKIVKGLVVRGSGQSPSYLLWSLDSVIKMSYIGGQAIFRFDTLSAQSSILAQNSVIEYDGAFFWIGVDRFLVYDGRVRELPNNQNLNYFFDNLNYAQRQKIWAMKIPRFGEVWWFYPSGDSTECDKAIIYNLREQCWYDAELTRSAGYYSQVFRFPVMADATMDADTSAYDVWLHENGVDKVKGESQVAIRSSVTTNDIGILTGGTQEAANGPDRWTRLTRVEPDFVMAGDMTIEVLSREFAQSDDVSASSATFSSDTEKVDFRLQARQLRLKFQSNQQGGDFEGGRVLVHLEPGDARS